MFSRMIYVKAVVRRGILVYEMSFASESRALECHGLGMLRKHLDWAAWWLLQIE